MSLASTNNGLLDDKAGKYDDIKLRQLIYSRGCGISFYNLLIRVGFRGRPGISICSQFPVK